MNTVEQMIAAFKQMSPDERKQVLDRLAEEQYLKCQTEYDLQQEQYRQLDRKRTSGSDKYGMPESTP
jgi:predicted Fe-S protein YdhL (DUF1289 family)